MRRRPASGVRHPWGVRRRASVLAAGLVALGLAAGPLAAQKTATPSATPAPAQKQAAGAQRGTQRAAGMQGPAPPSFADVCAPTGMR